MKNPVQVSEDIFVFRGFPAAVKHAEYNKNLINIKQFIKEGQYIDINID